MCVIPANADIATSDGLKMAREIDEEGRRTVGVLTKVKLIEYKNRIGLHKNKSYKLYIFIYIIKK